MINKIPFEIVLDLNPGKRGVIIKDSASKIKTSMIILDLKEFNKYKFELVKWLKKKALPEERFLPFETEIDGIWSYDKESKLIEARKSREEKSIELNDKIWLHEECKKRGIK